VSLPRANLSAPPQRDVRYLATRVAKRAAAAAAAAASQSGEAVTLAAADRNRPALSATTDFASIMARREPWYTAAAHVVVDGTASSPGGEPRPKEVLMAEVLKAFWARVEPGRVGGKVATRRALEKHLEAAATMERLLLPLL